MNAPWLFADFEVRPGERRLAVRGQVVQIGARAFDLLVALVERSDRVVSKHELLDVVWPKLVVEENNLQVHIHALRKLLGPSAITTVPGRGYRFTAEPVGAPPAPPQPDAGEALSREVGVHAADGNLPVHVSDLIGRADDLAALRAMLESQRLVTITGAGGIGKTRLAQAVAHELRGQHAQGAWMVELAAVTDPDLLVPLVAQTIGIPLSGARPPIDELADALRQQHLLLVLDNCEHLVDAVGALALRLLGSAPSVRLLGTSQELLRVAEERVYKVSPLAVPVERDLDRARHFGAVQLFAERARALERTFELDERNIDAVVDICARLDGMPLAIELAAARVPLLGVYGIHDRLGERFRVLTGGARVSLRRHQTLRAALDWSYQLLSDNEQKVFGRLALFSDGFVVEGAQALAADNNVDAWAVLDLLSALVDKSLVLVDNGTRPRYRLLETTRAYAFERLAEAGHIDHWLRRHAEATRTLVDRAVRQRDLDWLWAEMNNVRAAFAWATGPGGDDEIAVALATSSSMVLAVAGMVSEGMHRLLEVEPLVTAATPPLLAARYWQWLGRGGVDGRLPTSRCVEALKRAQALFTSLRQERPVHACLRMRAEALLASKDLAGASDTLAQAEAMERAGWPVADRVRRLRVQGLIHAAEGRHEASLAVSQRAFDMAETAGIERYVLILLADMARVHLQLGHAEQAGDQFHRLAERARHRRSQGLTLSQALAGLTAALTAQQRFDEAVEVSLQSVPLLRRCGIFLAHCDVYAWLMACLGRVQTAAQLTGAADAFHHHGETARDGIRQRARDEVMRLLGVTFAAGQVQVWLSEGAVSTEDALARMLEAALGAHTGHAAASAVDSASSSSSVPDTTRSTSSSPQ
ncbi:winged helix-turn-helix domain-containing protein [Rhizobacter sp. Root1221]|uniref:ATP-binding protein n=1 Tax=Rhizobacter sp. Root1221 TaxID=1736433 RepID=UPI000700279F|nr:winged helix-turn-helix domain-containing protein [Rhizobacter sp. Root1221]KQV83034.1 hypothetical protein ASC87_08825 [Rhizobacter sp. Root1221]